VTYVSSNTDVATIVGNNVTLIGAGNTTITASQPGNGDYNAANSVSQVFTVAKNTQAITFAALPQKTFGDAEFELVATSTTGLPIVFTSSNENIVRIIGNRATILAAGVVTISANQLGNNNFEAAATVNQPLTVAKATQAITFEALPQKRFGDAAFVLNATANSGLGVTYLSSNIDVATINGNSVTIVAAGTVTITASQAGNDNYLAATDVTQSLTVAKKSQTITFAAIANKTFGDADFDLEATSDATLPVTFMSSDDKVAVVTGNTVKIIGAGTVTITANQAGNGNFEAATASQILTVDKKGQAITFGEIAGKTFGDADFELTANSDSGLPVVFSSSDESVITITGKTAKIVGAGSATIIAVQSGNENFAQAQSVTQLISIAKKLAIVTITNLEFKADGDLKAVTVVTDPEGLAYIVTYNGSLIPPSEAGEYNVVVTINEANYEGEATATLVVRPNVTAVTLPQVSIEVYPNPASDYVVISSETSLEVIALYNMEGKLVKNAQNLGTGENTVDVSTLSAGVYHAIITDSNGGVHRKKIMIRK
jgi:hypothetical protein